MRILRELWKSKTVIVIMLIAAALASLVTTQSIPFMPQEHIDRFYYPAPCFIEDPDDLDVEGSGLGANRQKIDWLADCWNSQDRGFMVSGAYQVNQQTNSSFVIWDVIFFYEEKLNPFDSLATRNAIIKNNEMIIGEIISATAKITEPGFVIIHEHNWVTLKSDRVKKNPLYWVEGYEVKAHCLDKALKSMEESGDYTVWAGCAIAKDGKIILVDKGASDFK